MYNVQIYQVISPKVSGGTRYGIAPGLTTGFVYLDTQAPFILTKIMMCQSSPLPTGEGTSSAGFRLPAGLLFRIWDQSNGRQLFQADVSGIDDGYVPYSAFSTQQTIGLNALDQDALQSMMAVRFYNLPEECEFSAGGVIRVDMSTTTSATVYVSFLGYSNA